MRLKDVSVIDILWAPAFAILGWACAAMTAALDARAWIVLALVTVWAVRLGSHVWRRWRRLRHEDYRYATIRQRRGPNFPWTSLFWIFSGCRHFCCGSFLWPLQAAIDNNAPLNSLDAVGVSFALAGLAIEAIADMQLTRFRADPASSGRVLDTGLWAWSRHPKYFGDFAL